MKTQLSLQNLLKTQENDIYIFTKDDKDNVILNCEPQKFISFREVNFCNEVITTIEDDNKLICPINKVLTQIDTRHICDIYKNDHPIDIVFLPHDGNDVFMKVLPIHKDFHQYNFRFLTSNFFFIKTTDWEKYLSKDWSKK